MKLKCLVVSNTWWSHRSLNVVLVQNHFRSLSSPNVLSNFVRLFNSFGLLQQKYESRYFFRMQTFPSALIWHLFHLEWSGWECPTFCGNSGTRLVRTRSCTGCKGYTVEYKDGNCPQQKPCIGKLFFQGRLMLHVAFCSWLPWFSSHCYVNAGIWLALITWQNDWYKQGRHITFKCEGVKVFIKRPVAKINHIILWHNPFFPWKIWLQSPISLLNVERVSNCLELLCWAPGTSGRPKT